MSDVKPEQLEASYINSTSLILDVLVAAGVVSVDVLVQSIDQVQAGMMEKGCGQSAGHMMHFREFLLRRAHERSAVKSLLSEPPQGTG